MLRKLKLSQKKKKMVFYIKKTPVLLKIWNMNADLLQWFINFLIERNSGGTFKNEVISNKELGEELPKPIIRKFKKKKVHSPFMGSM